MIFSLCKKEERKNILKYYNLYARAQETYYTYVQFDILTSLFCFSGCATCNKKVIIALIITVLSLYLIKVIVSRSI